MKKLMIFVTILLFAVSASFAMAGSDSYVDNGDGTVTDTDEGLMWMKRTADVNEDGKIALEDRLDWEEAIEYSQNLQFAGYDDWRLPKQSELFTLTRKADGSRHATPPAINKEYFSSKEFPYWSSTEGWDDEAAWIVRFTNGGKEATYKTSSYYVRPVRDVK